MHKSLEWTWLCKELLKQVAEALLLFSPRTVSTCSRAEVMSGRDTSPQTAFRKARLKRSDMIWLKHQVIVISTAGLLPVTLRSAGKGTPRGIGI